MFPSVPLNGAVGDIGLVPDVPCPHSGNPHLPPMQTGGGAAFRPRPPDAFSDIENGIRRFNPRLELLVHCIAMSGENAQTRKLVALDLLRFVCAMLVVAFHYGASYAREPGATAASAFAGLSVPDMFVASSWYGWIGVELFFVISGYVIALSARSATAGLFLQRRVLRLAPAAWICASLTAIALLWSGAGGADAIGWRWVGSALFLPWLPQIDASYWTLGIEVNFYLLIAACLWRGGVAAIEPLPRMLALASAAFWAGHFLAGAGLGVTPPSGFSLLLLPHGCFFALGMFLERRARTGDVPPRAMLGLVLATCAIEIANQTTERMQAVEVETGFAIPFAIFIAGLLVIAHADRLAIGGRRARVAAILGLASYPLYLIHQDAGAVLMAAMMRNGAAFAVVLATTAAAAVAAAVLCTLFAEPRLRGALAAIISRRRAPMAPGISRPVA